MIYELDFEWTRERKNSEFFATRKVNTFTRMCFSCVCSPDFVGVFLFHFFSLIVFVCVLKYIFFCERSNQLVFFFRWDFLVSVHFHRENEFVFFGLFHLITFQYLVDIFQVFSSGIIDSTENHFVLILFLSFRSHSFPLSPLFFDSYFSKSNTHVYICIRFSRMFASMRLSSFSSFPSFIPYLICYHIHFHKYIFYDMCFVVAVVVA